MKQFVFAGPDAVKDCIIEMDVSATHTKIKNAVGCAELMEGDDDLENAEEYASTLLRFIESGELKLELERIYAEHGRINLNALPDVPFCSLDAGYFASISVLKRLYVSWKRRKRNSQPIPIKAAEHWKVPR